MTLPRFTRTLHFRISTIFVLMLVAVGAGFWLWLNATVFSPDIAADEQNWYENLAEDELDSLAAQLNSGPLETAAVNSRLVKYGETVRDFEVELVAFDDEGNYLGSSRPDSLSQALPKISSRLLNDMSGGTWDYNDYPNPDDIEAYENRIFEVDRLFRISGQDSLKAGYLVASYEPLVIGIAELEGEERTIKYQAVLVILVYAGLSGLVIMSWMSRRITRLSKGMKEFTAGDLSHRVDVKSRDEIGTLAFHFNTMADHIQDMVGKLQEKELFQRQLIANISHDLRTPMASMRGYAETLTMNNENLSRADQDRYLNIISANLQHLDDLIDHMLTLSRFESGQAVFQMEEFPLCELADSVIMRSEPLAKELGINLDLECSADCPDLVKADPMQIAQLLQNLIDNGIKYNRQGGSLMVSLKQGNNNRVMVSVQDTGMGISEEDLPHIFERFYTADKSRTRHSSQGMAAVKQHLGQSSGLGLAIAAKIAAGHDTELTVESSLGAGSIFRFSLAAGSLSKTMEAEG